MASPSPILQALNRHRQLDPNAVMRVVGQEGGSGGVGDNGTSFGPFQLHAGGALPAAIWARGPQFAQQWAWSQPGLDYALSAIDKVAGGQHGAQAVNSIVRGFERPADPDGEVARALGGKVGGAAAGPGALPPAAAAAAPGNTHQPLLDLFSRGGRVTAEDFLQGLQGARPLVAAAQAQRAPMMPIESSGPTGPARSGGLASVGGIQVDPRVASQVQSVISRFGVSPTSGFRDAAHNQAVGGAGNSDHLRGDAVDFGGPSQALTALYDWAQGRFPYVEPMAQAKNHVHISFLRPGA